MSDLQPAICERQFQQVVAGQATSFRVAWMQPVANGNDWACEYVIEWPARAWRSRRIHGVDSTQALLLAMKLADTELRIAEPRVFWFDPGDELGLPPQGDGF